MRVLIPERVKTDVNLAGQRGSDLSVFRATRPHRHGKLAMKDYAFLVASIFCSLPQGELEMMKLLLWAILIIFIIGLLVVTGVFKMIF
ncbi:hypothetical protein [Franconibacter pulveris]|jgi:hypothetical protein|uniref:hypothetical protein n=1 Tax=Franconibacter pulveris TaxID=435910 RepID=UPI003FA40E1D